MLRRLDRGSIVFLIAIASILGLSPATAAASDEFDDALKRATALLPHRPEKIVIVDLDDTTHLL
jgi:hypothetical protein